MHSNVDILLFGTGEFAARILFDIAATAPEPVTVLVLGRNASRLAWLRTASNARAAIFGRPVNVLTDVLPSFDKESLSDALSRSRPSVVVQTASLQTASVLRSEADAWSRLVAEGGLSATAVFQSVLSLRIGLAVGRTLPGCHFLNACFPDVTNELLKSAGVPVLSGVGNVGILASAFAGAARRPEPGRVKILAHYQQLALWRKVPDAREGSTPRVWIDDKEVVNVFGRFEDVMLSPQTAFDISGATGVPLMLALAAGRPWRGHVPGVHGLPGGYPVSVDSHGIMKLDLPEGISEAEAIAWNQQFESATGLIVEPGGRARYTGTLRRLLADVAPDLADGFEAAQVETVADRMSALRERLQAQTV